MVRGIERRAIFRDDRDRDDFVRRLAAHVESGAVMVFAWALLPNHAHLLVRTGKRPLAHTMRSFLTGYAGAFNRRYKRHGHLFQNRYKSVVVEEEPYFLELVRYVHLNPLRAGIVPDLAALGRYRYSGHAPLMGRRSAPWQDTREVLGRFGRGLATARAQYQQFVASGVARGRRPEFQGGGLVRSAGGWQAVRELRRGREAYRSDERILGGTAFVTRLLEAAEAGPARATPRVSIEGLVATVCEAVGLKRALLAGGGRRPAAVEARAGIAYLWTEVLGRPGRPLAAILGTRAAAVYKAAARGLRNASRWRRLLADVSKET
jgi:REP element-mobilizing transposase RayT